jgi:predicted N-acetyltransferase YhbS
MPDMLVRLYDLPDAVPCFERAAATGCVVRRAEPWERESVRRFVAEHFQPLWAVEADRAYNHTPVTAFVATRGAEIVGFAAYECTRRGFFGPTGVREDLRGAGLGAALLFRCLESMREMGYAYAVIGGVGPAAFYEKVCGALVIPGSEVGVYGPLYESMKTKESA